MRALRAGEEIATTDIVRDSERRLAVRVVLWPFDQEYKPPWFDDDYDD